MKKIFCDFASCGAEITKASPAELVLDIEQEKHHNGDPYIDTRKYDLCPTCASLVTRYKGQELLYRLIVQELSLPVDCREFTIK